MISKRVCWDKFFYQWSVELEMMVIAEVICAICRFVRRRKFDFSLHFVDRFQQ